MQRVIVILKVYPFPSDEQRNIIVSMLGEIITFENQSVYKNNIAFKRAMEQLRVFGIMKCRRVRNGCNEYKLSLFGEHIANMLIDFSKAKK